MLSTGAAPTSRGWQPIEWQGAAAPVEVWFPRRVLPPRPALRSRWAEAVRRGYACAVAAPAREGLIDSRDWVQRYLALLGVERRPPDAAALAELTRAHILSVPFENVTSLLRRLAYPGAVPPVDADELLARWERRGAGGVCFEIADLFGRLLAALGYRVHPVLGHITFPGSHQALVVRVGDASLLVDVGNGAPFFEPIPLREAVEVRRAGLAYRFRPNAGGVEWVQERWIEEKWTPFCRYELHPADPLTRAAAYQRHHVPGETWVTGSLTLIRCFAEEVLLLRDEELSRFTGSGKRTDRIATLADYSRVTAEVFGLPELPIADGVRAWRDNVAKAGLPTRQR